MNEENLWVEQQKAFLKKGQAEKVIEALKPHLEPRKTEDKHAPVRRCLRYLSNRPGQLDYPEAQKRGFTYRFRRNRKCAPVCYSGTSENSRCMVDTGECPDHAFFES